MRFTERYDDIFATTKDGKETHEKGVRIKDKVGGFEKFAKLEDIEEELGIDLITLFKALKNNKVWVRTLKNNFHKSIECRDGVRIESLFWLNVRDSNGHWVDYRIKDYGKTWALTKEELL